MCLIAPMITNAQKTSKAAPLCDKAKQCLKTNDFQKALTYLNQAQTKDPNYPDLYIMKGDIFNFQLQSDSAYRNYQRAIDLIGDPDPMLYFIAGNEGAKCGAYEYALKTMQLFLQKGLQYSDVLPEAQKIVANCQFAIESMKNPTTYELVNLGQLVNSDWDEFLAAITADDQELVFTVKHPRNDQTVCSFCLNEEDLYSSTRSPEGSWLPRQILGPPISTGYNEGAQCISPDGKYLLYTMCDADFGMGSCDLYWAKRIGDRWSRPRNFGAPVNTSAWESQPTMAADGMTIYFASSRAGGYGGMDIWKTTMTAEGEFSIPENLGPAINTLATMPHRSSIAMAVHSTLPPTAEWAWAVMISITVRYNLMVPGANLRTWAIPSIRRRMRSISLSMLWARWLMSLLIKTAASAALTSTASSWLTRCARTRSPISKAMSVMRLPIILWPLASNL